MATPDCVVLPMKQMEEMVAWLQQLLTSGGNMLTLLQSYQDGEGKLSGENVNSKTNIQSFGPDLPLKANLVKIENHGYNVMNQEKPEDFGVKLPKGIKIFTYLPMDKEVEGQTRTELVKETSTQIKNNTVLLCSQCEYKTNSKKRLQKHVIKRHDMSLACDQCAFETSHNKLLLKHLLRNHGTKRRKPDEMNTEKKCEHCSFQSNRRSTFSNHQLYEHGTRDYLCDQCDKIFFTKHHLSCHIQSFHVGAIFDCTVCGFKTSTTLNLKRHMIKRHSEKNILCTECPFKTSSGLTLTNHKRKNHTEKENWPKCTECKYSSWNKILVKQHYRTVHIKARIKCEICPSTFTQIGNMKAHMQNNHKDMLIKHDILKTRALFSERYTMSI